MEVHRSSHEAAGNLTAPAVALGNFDGVHRGHQALFARARAAADADRQGGAVTALTFDPHPARFFNPELAPPHICTEQQKLELMQACGVDAVVIEPFTADLASLTPRAFAEQVLVRRLGARHVVVGHGFRFGKKKAGNLAVLQDLGQELGFRAHGVETVRVASITVSSTKIREFLLMGRVGGASLLLGRDYMVTGPVVTGKARGRTIGIPTANIQSENEIMPRRGVYAGWARLPGGEVQRAVINIGTNPTFEKAAVFTLEAHLLDFDRDLYGQRLGILFTQRLRDERRYESVDALLAAIHHDIEEARAILRTPAVTPVLEM